MSNLILGLPSKGRLQADTIAWFADRGIEIARDGTDREYSAVAQGFKGLDVVMLSAGEISRELSAGRIHLGVTGEDLIQERLADHQSQVRLASHMGFGHADLIVAVPAFWIDVETLHDLDEVAHLFRIRNKMPLRVATYHNLTRRFFQKHGVTDYRLVDSQGATEAAPKNLTAEAIVDITSSGETLRANHLKPLSDVPILRSQACLWVSHMASWTPAGRQLLIELEDLLRITRTDA